MSFIEPINLTEAGLRKRAHEGLAIGVVALVDVVFIASWSLGQMEIIEIVTTHAMVVFAVAMVLLLSQKDGRLQLVTTVLLLLLLGPLGGPAMLVSRVVSGVLDPLDRQLSTVETDVVRQRSLAERICEDIRQGRRHNPGKDHSGNFGRVFKRGDRVAHSEAMAVITRKFTPEMRPALNIALRSRDAALRVQAAAAFAKLRTSYSDRATEVLLALQGNPRGRAAAELANEARSVGESGFIEDDLARHLLAAAKLLGERSGMASDTAQVAGRPRPLDASISKPDMRRYSCGGIA